MKVIYILYSITLVTDDRELAALLTYYVYCVGNQFIRILVCVHFSVSVCTCSIGNYILYIYMYNSFIFMLNAVHAIDIIHVQLYNVLKGKLLWGGWTLLENGQCQILNIAVTILNVILLCIIGSLFIIDCFGLSIRRVTLSYIIHFVYILLSNYFPKAKQQGGVFFYIHPWGYSKYTDHG